MKKKKYIQPEIQTIELKAAQLLTASDPDIKDDIPDEGAKWGEDEDDI